MGGLESIIDALGASDPSPLPLRGLARSRRQMAVVHLHDRIAELERGGELGLLAASTRLRSAPSAVVGAEASGPHVSWLVGQADPAAWRAAVGLCDVAAAHAAGLTADDRSLEAIRCVWPSRMILACGGSVWLDADSGDVVPLVTAERVGAFRSPVVLAGRDGFLGGDAIDPYPKLVDSESISAFSSRLAAAADLLRLAAPGLSRSVEGFLRAVVPMQRPAAGVPSTSTNAVPGAVCITADEDVVLLAEQVVHECSHGFLFMLQELDPLLDPSIHGDGWEGGLTYSPWRDDPRPLNGLLHGLVVFTRVGFMHARLAPGSGTSRARLAAIVPQLRVALDTLAEAAAWTPLGDRLLASMREAVPMLAEIAAPWSDVDPIYVECSTVASGDGPAEERQARHRERHRRPSGASA